MTLTDSNSSNIWRSIDAFTRVGCPDSRLFDKGSHGNKNRDGRGGRRVQPPEFKVWIHALSLKANFKRLL